MKKTLLFLALLCSIAAFSRVNTDSLMQAAANNYYPDTLRLRAYERLTKYFLREDKDSCRKLCELGLKFSKQINNPRFEWSFYNRIGISYYYESNFEKTADFWLKGLEVAEMAQDTFTIPQTINNLGSLYHGMKDYNKAIEYYSRSLPYKKKYNDLIGIAITQINIGLCYVQMEKLSEAEEMIKEALVIVEKIEDHNNKQQIYNNIGSYYSYIGSHFDNKKLVYEGLKYYVMAETELEETDNIMDKLTTMLSIGETYLYLDDTLNGFKYINEGKALAKQENLLERLSVAYEMLMNHYLTNGDYKLAYFYNDSLTRITDSINTIVKQVAIEELQTKYQSEKKEKENLRLKQKVSKEELKNLRQKRINTISQTILFVLLVVGLFITYLLMRLRNKNRELVKNKIELEKLNENLKISKEETEKALEFKSLFLANMSHEIRTPLNIIIGFNSILRKNITDPKLATYTESIELSSYNLLRFLNDILDMSKIEAGRIMLNPETIKIRKMISDVQELFELKTAEKNLEFIVEIENDLPDEIVIDEVRLRQILVNLIGNAIKFTDQGHIKLMIDVPKNGNYNFEFSTTKNIRIRVEDTGIGIEPNDLELIFESFRQVNIKQQKQLGGTGLGLAISKRLTEMMNGTISVESKPGIGSTFTILFKDVPVGYQSGGNPIAQFTNLPESLDYQFTGGSLLIADDEELNRSLIKVCFENTKVKVFEATNGEEAIEIAKQHLPDMILMDVKMPIIDGIEATQIIKNTEELKDIQIIAFSASNIFDRLEDKYLEMYAGLLSKPVLVDELYAIAAKFLPHQLKPKKPLDNNARLKRLMHFKNDRTFVTPEIIERLTTVFKPRCLLLLNSNSMNEILEFTDDLIKFAEENKLAQLLSYAQNIKQAGRSFNTQKVHSLLKQYPDIVEILK
jgi:two-component system sensor histidine kinase EvgS